MSDPIDALGIYRQRICAAAASRAPIRLRGGGSKDFYGQAPVGEVLDTRGYAGIVEYDPTELVITARCGTPLAALEQAMAERGQFLAFEAPSFGGAATVGGVMAAGLSGPRRAAAGSVRDFVLGARMMNSKGEVLTFGGQVMKNVAGYDVSRLLCGSLGTLGLILEVSLKALPKPSAELTLKLELPQDKALEALNRWAGRPLPISASTYFGGDLAVRLSGANAAVSAARERIGGELIAAARATHFWTGIREQSDPFFTGNAGMPLWRLSVPSSSPSLAIPGEQLIEWGGALRWLATNADARTIREHAQRLGGHATLFRGGDKSIGVFQPLSPVLAKLNKKLKAEFDPASIFNRGRISLDSGVDSEAGQLMRAHN